MARATVASTFQEKMADPYYDWRQESTNLGNDIVGDAKALDAHLSSPRSVQGGFDRDQNIKRSAAIEARGPDYTYGDVAYDTAMGAAIPASFLAGPVGMAAGGALALDSLKNAIKDPSLTNISATALGALPFVRGAGKLLSGGAKAESKIGAIDRFMPNTPAKAGAALADDAARVEPKQFEILTGAGQFDNAAGRAPVAAPQGGSRFSVNSAPRDVQMPVGRLGAKGPGGVENAIDDVLLESAGQPDAAYAAIQALKQATAAAAPVADEASQWARMGRGTIDNVNDFTNQGPRLAEGMAGDIATGTAGSVSAPGFTLGGITPMNQVPVSRGQQAADSMRQVAQRRAQEVAASQQRRAIQSVNEPSVTDSFGPPTDDEINAAIEAGGYTYGQGLGALVRRVR